MKMMHLNVSSLDAMKDLWLPMEDGNILNMYTKVLGLRVNMAVEKRTPLTKMPNFMKEHANETQTGK